ncbi:nucleotide sugar dehydrogenase [Flexibacterium corallicola]|uniref:nucleotide sugar dehydrogenase n=1 Tax=Flexibacterium corallicola TaxID=3037259 RepID=UPI00286EFFD1|nr:nucleotide sugar dehydrogenase [Pseudovibrio sp. M1P-2-3]
MSIRQRLSIIGLGYVGLPVACAFAQAGYTTIAYDRDIHRIRQLKELKDRTHSVEAEHLADPNLQFTCHPEDLGSASIHIITVPTPIDRAKAPDLSALKDACTTVGTALSQGDLVILESTVFPGATEEIAVPILEQASSLSCGHHFQVGYSPERINPGDAQHSLESVIKIISAGSTQALEQMQGLYGSIIKGGLYLAPSIRVAEAAKAIENTQRDLNIALMNELAVLFHHIGIDTRDVLEAAQTKWNFLPFKPGLVGGHCIGVDPYYLTHKAHQLGLSPQVILAGRSTNENMSVFIATQIIQACIKLARPMPPKVAILGITYKENVPDTRNSKTISLAQELVKFGASLSIYDPLADAKTLQKDHGLQLETAPPSAVHDAVVLAVPHSVFFEKKQNKWELVMDFLGNGSTFVADLHNLLERKQAPESIELWRL